MSEPSPALVNQTSVQRIVVADGALAQIQPVLNRWPGETVGVLGTERGLASPLGRALTEALSAQPSLQWTDVPPHTPLAIAQRIAHEWAGVDLRAVVALGGGSVSDMAKAVSVALATGGDVEQYFSRRIAGKVQDKHLADRLVPVVAVPTTLSGAELTPGAGVTENGRKHVLWDEGIAARLIAYETSDLNDLPDELVRTTGMNAVAHCVEATYSSQGSVISTALAERGLSLVVEGMLRQLVLHERGPSTRYLLFAGSALAGQALSNARVCLHHALCHVLGARYGVPHGAVNAVMLGHVADFNAADSVEAQILCTEAIVAGYRRALSRSPEAGTLGPLLRTIERLIGAPVSLADIGLPEVDVDFVADALREERGVAFNPRPVGRADLDELFARACAPASAGSLA
jgi:alcohol dehydrogenase class IV